jgi:hypothetical protein
VLRESVQKAAADVLMASHKEAWTILLEARMKVIDGWGGETESPH